MAVDYTKLSFSSDKQIDKVVYESSVITYSVPAASSRTESLTNPYGSKCFITLAWSTDGTSYYPAQAYTAVTDTYTVNGWVDQNSVYVYLENNSASPLTMYIKYALDTIT
jgi:hypothetical protein